MRTREPSPSHTESAEEYAFDGLIGPTHHHAGLSPGNLQSQSHAGDIGHPRAAALQGLEKLRRVSALGGRKAVFPPQERPYLPVLRRLGFRGSDRDVLEAAYRHDPLLLSAASSASSMWAANAATVAPSSDTSDGRVHFVPANLNSMLHRSFEAPATSRMLQRLFQDEQQFCVHEPLPSQAALADEGAANHTRLTTLQGYAHVLFWGRAAGVAALPQRFPARQTRDASAALARLLRVEESALLWQQDPEGIDAGAFHSDVLCVGAGSLLLLHERAVVHPTRFLSELDARLGPEFKAVLATEQEFPVVDAVASYAFNCELIRIADGYLLVAPLETQGNTAARNFVESLEARVGKRVQLCFVDVNASMNNGGGPACLRLRVQLTERERATIRARVFYEAGLDAELVHWVGRHYRDRLRIEDLRDPGLLEESRRALDELTGILGLGSIYEFQK
ncbi:MAG TPA: N-succinylarginine dihydrolase [Polyangiaceae bacterium]|nr:N-succinylarginine dihydrolase [Polyangiaceae bacterium]